MQVRAINLAEKLALIGELWAPSTVAALNDYDIKVVKVDGEFVWHDHAATDELFLVLNGQLTIRLEDGEVVLNPGELYVVPRGKRHCPIATAETHVLLIEPRGTINTGEIVNELTRSPTTI